MWSFLQGSLVSKHHRRCSDALWGPPSLNPQNWPKLGEQRPALRAWPQGEAAGGAGRGKVRRSAELRNG